MDFVFISPFSHHGAYSGAKVRLVEMCRELSLLGKSVRVYAPFEVPSSEGVKYSFEGGAMIKVWRFIYLFFSLHCIRSRAFVFESPLLWFCRPSSKSFFLLHDTKAFDQRAARHGSAIKIFLYRFLILALLRLGGRILTVSRTEKDRIISLLGVDEGKVIVVYNGVSDLFFGSVRSGTKEYDLMYVSNFAAHKGHVKLLRFLIENELVDKKICFVGVDFGQLDSIQKFIEEYSLNVDFFSGLSTKNLIDLYDKSRCFVFPSDFEGFGMPYVEARARGLNVFHSNIPVFKELQSLIGGHPMQDLPGFLSSFNDEESSMVTHVASHFQWKKICSEFVDKVSKGEKR